jgi:hypothetical protein
MCATGAKSDGSRRADDVGVLPALVWLLLQLLPLLLAANRVQLWARVERPVETHALTMLLATQAIASSLLFPWLMHNVRVTVLTLLSSMPFVHLAGVMSQATGAQVLGAAATMTVWLGSLAAWRVVLDGRLKRMVGIAIGSCITVGTPIAAYLRAEFAPIDSSPDLERLLIAVSLVSLVIASMSVLLKSWAERGRYPHHQHN